jgi:hypothetical protein
VTQSPAKPHWFAVVQGVVGIVAAIFGIVFIFLNYKGNDQKGTPGATPPGPVSPGLPKPGATVGRLETSPNEGGARDGRPHSESPARPQHLTTFLHKVRPDRATWTVDGAAVAPSEASTSRETILKLRDGDHTVRAVWSTLDCTVHVDVPVRVEPVLLDCQPR